MSTDSTLATSSNASGTSASSLAQSKPRSCAICAKRKVSCDKQYPCGRCQRAGIRCVPPTVEKRPRWARNLVRTSNNGGLSASPSTPEGVSDRLRALEAVVRDLRGELDRARSSFAPTADSRASDAADNAPIASLSSPVHADISQTRRSDLSRAFWSRVDNELSGFRHEISHGDHQDQESEAGSGPSPSERQPSAVSADTGTTFLFVPRSQNMTTDASTLFPLASQIPFLLDFYQTRVHSVMVVPHMPSLKKLIRHRQTGFQGQYAPSDEALLFAVFYAAIGSLDTDEVTASFHMSKSELSGQYRKGLEMALARADFLSNPSENLVQALLIFLGIARLEDNSKYLWMMTGLVIRMARFLRYHEDGANISKVTAFQTEMRRRIWWNLCALDMRATEDQGTELAITGGSFSTKLPSNVNDYDLSPEMRQTPPEITGLSDASLLRLCSKVGRTAQHMMAAGSSATMDEQIHFLDALAQELDRDYFGITDQSQHETYLAAAGTMRVFLARLSLLAFVPTLCSSDFSLELARKALIAAIEIAELSHALNTHPSCQPWRWVYQTQQHWHAVVFILLEVCRRPWSPTIERAWLALQSPWLLRSRVPTYRNPSVWIPLKKLMDQARSHRDAELLRLRKDNHAADNLAWEDEQQMPIPSSSITFPMYYNEHIFCQRWWQAVNGPSTSKQPSPSATFNTAGSSSGAHSLYPSPNRATTGHAAHLPYAQHTHDQGATASALQPGSSVPAMTTSGPEYLGNLDIFLGEDAAMGSFEGMEDFDLSNVNWNSWFESASGTL